MEQEEKKMKTLGVIGGLGPMATVYFLQLVTTMCDADIDQEHMKINLISNPTIPDRTQYILGKSTKNPVDAMVEAGKALGNLQSDVIAIPCITAHFFHDELEERIGIPIINAISETTGYLKKRNIHRVGIMATDGTIQSGLFQKAFFSQGMEAVIPSEAGQKKVMNLIYENVKAGTPIDMDSFQKVAEELFANGSEVILLACTELSIIKRDYTIGAGFLDVLDVLARKAVCSCNKLRIEYEEVITK